MSDKPSTVTLAHAPRVNDKRSTVTLAHAPRVNEQISQNPRRVAHCKVSVLATVCRRSFAAKANLLAIETALLTRRQQSAEPQDKVCQVGVTVNTE